LPSLSRCAKYVHRSPSHAAQRRSGPRQYFSNYPSLALFGFLIPIPFIGGIGRRTAIVALVLYALLPILRNTYVGLTGIDPAVLEAAEAMGMRSRKSFGVFASRSLARSFLPAFAPRRVITIGVATSPRP